jgi:cell division protein FtsB
MTIIQPHKNKRKTGVLIAFLTLSCISAAVWAIFSYNQVVELRHEVDANKGNLNKIEVSNAELKDGLYKLVDLNGQSSSTRPQSLVLDKDPEYVKLTDNR